MSISILQLLSFGTELKGRTFSKVYCNIFEWNLSITEASTHLANT